MKAAKRKSEESGSRVPAYIVTFSDMVTLLLTFFVLLLSLAEKQDEGLFQKGQDSFRRAVADFGLSGLLFNKNMGNQFDHPKIKYKIDKKEDDAEDRPLDLATEVYRRIIEDIEKTMKIMPSQITCEDKTFHVTDITFADGGWTLDSRAKAYLDNYTGQLQESLAGERPVLYVVGLAAEEPGIKEQWLVSARRAQAVADYISRLLDKEKGWTVYSWGAGAGGVWTAQTGVLSTKTQIAIAVLTHDPQTGH